MFKKRNQEHTYTILKMRPDVYNNPNYLSVCEYTTEDEIHMYVRNKYWFDGNTITCETLKERWCDGEEREFKIGISRLELAGTNESGIWLCKVDASISCDIDGEPVIEYCYIGLDESKLKTDRVYRDYAFEFLNRRLKEIYEHIAFGGKIGTGTGLYLGTIVETEAGFCYRIDEEFRSKAEQDPLYKLTIEKNRYKEACRNMDIARAKYEAALEETRVAIESGKMLLGQAPVNTKR